MEDNLFLPAGTELNKGSYQIIEKIGAGAFSFVYKAKDTLKGLVVVIKEFYWHEGMKRDERGYDVMILRGKKGVADEYRSKFHREYEKIKSFDNYNIIEVYDSFKENNTLYYVMEFIEGAVSLSDYCRERQGGRIGEDEAIYFVRQIAEALKQMHGMKYNHSDVKPDNILIDRVKKRAVLIDFGTAHKYERGLVDVKKSVRAVSNESRVIPVATLGYAHPNAYKVNCFVPARDIYSLGATLYNIVTGGNPYLVETSKISLMSEPIGKLVMRAMKQELDNMDIDEFIELLTQCSKPVDPKEKLTGKVEILGENQIFVFGSNIYGKHSGGAARQALLKWGAIWGVASGPQGKTYAIPTVAGRANNVKLIEPYVKQFEVYATEHPNLEFFVTEIGCGNAGFTERQIAPFFSGCAQLPNVRLPKSFWEVLGIL